MKKWGRKISLIISIFVLAYTFSTNVVYANTTMVSANDIVNVDDEKLDETENKKVYIGENYKIEWLFRGNGGLKTATTLCLSRLSGIQLSVRKWNAYIRAYKVHHIKHILYVSEAISFTDNELNLVISCFNPGITYTIADCI